MGGDDSDSDSDSETGTDSDSRAAADGLAELLATVVALQERGQFDRAIDVLDREGDAVARSDELALHGKVEAAAGRLAAAVADYDRATDLDPATAYDLPPARCLERYAAVPRRPVAECAPALPLLARVDPRPATAAVLPQFLHELAAVVSVPDDPGAVDPETATAPGAGGWDRRRRRVDRPGRRRLRGARRRPADGRRRRPVPTRGRREWLSSGALGRSGSDRTGRVARFSQGISSPTVELFASAYSTAAGDSVTARPSTVSI